MEEPENMLDIWKNVSSDIVLWDQSFNEIEKINRQIESVKRRMPSTGKLSFYVKFHSLLFTIEKHFV